MTATDTNVQETTTTTTTTTQTLASQLVEKTGFKPRAGEAIEKARARLVRAAAALADSDWQSLSAEAQQWVNTGIDLLNQHKTVEPVDGEEALTATVTTTGAPAEGKAKGGKAKGGKAKAAPTEDAPEKPARPAKREKQPEAPREAGVVTLIAQEMVANPGVTPEGLEAMLTKAAVKWSKSTISVQRTLIARVIRLLHAGGELKNASKWAPLLK